MTEMRSRDLIAALDEASLSRFHLGIASTLIAKQ